MSSQAVSIGSFEAKTKFSELLRNVERGSVYSINRNGKSVAVLQSAKSAKQSAAVTACERIMSRSENLKSRPSLKEIKGYKNAGRKY